MAEVLCVTVIKLLKCVVKRLTPRNARLINSRPTPA